MAVTEFRKAAPVAVALAGVALFFVPAAQVPAFYESFLYIIFFWIALATSWNIFSGYAHYLSFGHGAFFGVGVYTTATLASKHGVPFLWTLPAAALASALLGAAIGAVVFRLDRLKGELFALLTFAVAFVVGTIVLNTDIDGGSGVFLSAVPMPNLAGSATATIYVLGLALALVSIALAYGVYHSRLGLGLLAIHDDEEVAEVKGVPTFRYKIVAFALSSAIAGAVGGVHAMYVGYVTVAETFGITVPLYAMLMSILGGTRHWLGPAVGATLIAASLYAFTGGEQAVVGRAIVAAALILVIVLLPSGVVPSLLRLWQRSGIGKPARTAPPPVETAAVLAPTLQSAPSAPRAEATVPRADGPVLLDCVDLHKSFGGVQALAGATLDVREGEILGLVGPNGSGKTTLINMVSGHYRLDHGRILFRGQSIGDRPAHAVAALGIARTYQIPRHFANLSALENVVLAATFGRAEAAERATIRDEARHWLEFTGIGAKSALLPGQLNLHERKFLELARALACRPRLLLLDEVLSGLNPTEVESAISLIRGIHERGTTIVFIEHLMRAVVELSDRIAVMNEGAVFAVGAPQEVMRNPEVVSIYLGKSYAA